MKKLIKSFLVTAALLTSSSIASAENDLETFSCKLHNSKLKDNVTLGIIVLEEFATVNVSDNLYSFDIQTNNKNTLKLYNSNDSGLMTFILHKNKNGTGMAFLRFTGMDSSSFLLKGFCN